MTDNNKTELPIDKRIEAMVNPLGNACVTIFHLIALFAIGAATVWSGVTTFLNIMGKSHAGVEDLLLLFIYLEIGAMVGIYFKTNHMPVRFLIYVAITAVTRLIIDLVNVDHSASMQILVLGGTILLLAIANAVVRYASHRFPSGEVEKHD
ncbi:MAG: hypothetical protein RIQ84_638 [Pseudomonadota bacterium]|jgi:protein PsiE